MNTAFAVVQNKSSQNIMCLFLDPSEAHKLRDGAKKFLRMLITSSWSNSHLVDYLCYIIYPYICGKFDHLTVVPRKQELHIKNGKTYKPFRSQPLKKSSYSSHMILGGIANDSRMWHHGGASIRIRSTLKRQQIPHAIRRFRRKTIEDGLPGRDVT